MDLFMVDGIGPFFRGIDQRRINWSKIPFKKIEKDGWPDPCLMDEISVEFNTLVAKASALGFNAITLDDLAHLGIHPDYGSGLKSRIEAYRAAFAPLFEMAVLAGMRIYLTTDIIFQPPDYPYPLNELEDEILPFLRTILSELFDAYPAIAGIILRIGECDGVDVEGDFQSKIAIRTTRQARRLLQGLLPLFEDKHRQLVLRLWTVGAYPIGDLLWNKHTFDRTFKTIHSDALVLSLKYGESDFFRYLPINSLFFRSNHKKILELQTRREYEGFGTYPSFVGWDYEHYRTELQGIDSVIGVSIWTCTGGWGPFHRRTFLDQDAVWNEINTYVTLRIYRDGISTEEAVNAYLSDNLPGKPPEKLLALLRYSDEVVKELLYIDDLARSNLFFRRLRIPPLLAVYWNYIIINHSMRKILNCLVDKGKLKIYQGQGALRKIKKMRELADDLDLPAADIDFMYDTFEILSVAREYYFAPYDPEIAERLRELKMRYKSRYRKRYAVKMDFFRFRTPSWQLRWLLRLLLRKRHSYRRIDRILLIRLLSLLSPFSRYFRNRLLPDFIHHQAMGMKSIFK